MAKLSEKQQAARDKWRQTMRLHFEQPIEDPLAITAPLADDTIAAARERHTTQQHYVRRHIRGRKIRLRQHLE